jgi:hypothetical protein
MKVELSGADLALTPAPTHEFDVQRIAATGVERVKWIVSPKGEGDHVLLVRFNVSPATFKAIPISANGQAQGTDPQILLPVKVFTIYGVPKATVLIAKGGVGLAVVPADPAGGLRAVRAVLQEEAEAQAAEEAGGLVEPFRSRR